MSKADLHARVENDLTLHPPSDSAIAEAMDYVRARGKAFAHILIDQCPESRELSLALTDVEHATQHAIAALARYQDRVMLERALVQQVVAEQAAPARKEAL